MNFHSCFTLFTVYIFSLDSSLSHFFSLLPVSLTNTWHFFLLHTRCFFLQLLFFAMWKKKIFSVRLVFTMGTKALECLCFYFGTKYRLERKHGSCFTSVDFEYIDLCFVSHAAFNVWLWLQTCENIFLFFS